MPTPAIQAAAPGGNCVSRPISPAAIATGRKHTTPTGMLIAMP
jgi:hypothetical protein